jgi:hypothetical protein
MINNKPIVLPVQDVNDDVEIQMLRYLHESLHFLCEQRDVINALLGGPSLERELLRVKRHGLPEHLQFLFQNLCLFGDKLLLQFLRLLDDTFLK